MRTYKSIVILGALAMTAFAGQAFAAPSPMDDLKAARDDLAHGKMSAALTKTEMAETGLLNQQQTNGNVANAALDSVKKAHQELEAQDRQSAKADIENALNALGASS